MNADTNDVLERLADLAHDLWWTTNPDAQRLFASVDPGLWEALNHAPLAVLNALPRWRREAVSTDPAMLEALEAVEAELVRYHTTPTWWERNRAEHQEAGQADLQVAYLCMEYALHESLRLYAGGLGVLAGDHLKSASDLGVPVVAVGILWKHGYYRQDLTREGQPLVRYPTNDPADLPVVDTAKRITLDLAGEEVVVRIWRATVGRVPLLLLDTDIDPNGPDGRRLTHFLYNGDREYRIQQELLLAVGGVAALEACGYDPTVFHLNEGHAAFAALERTRRLVVEDDVALDEALARVTASTVFTTHTPVPQGNDRFVPELVLRYVGPMAEAMGMTEEQLLALGADEDPEDVGETFCMTVLALRTTARCNGVAELHGATARAMWQQVHGAESPDEVPIGHVTNGVHPPTWTAIPASLNPGSPRPRVDLVGAGPDDDPWAAALADLSDADLWTWRQELRHTAIVEVRRLLRRQWTAAHVPREQLAELHEILDEDALTIGFARRFALYKRAPLIFSSIKRLERIVGNTDRPVQILFAGKAHPADPGGHEAARTVYELSRRPKLRGRIHLLADYDMHIGRTLTAGCDVWLNNPLRPLEASGTSGMKVPLNGGINCSILDGWWPEAYDGRNGWSLGGDQGLPRKKQDKADAQAIYRTLEEEIVPAFYERNRSGVPKRWVRMMRRSLRTVFPQFSTHRMLDDYLNGYYLPAHHAGRADAAAGTPAP